MRRRIALVLCAAVAVASSAGAGAFPLSSHLKAAFPMSTFVHIVAHEDDDLFFLNPDLSNAIRSGEATATVYMTAGQLNGNGSTDAERARSRQRGIQDAYARMAGVPVGGLQAEWDGTLLTLGSRSVERYRLRGTAVDVLFLALPDGQLGALDAGGSVSTVPAAGGLGGAVEQYTRARAVTVLAEIVDAYQPRQVRTLDRIPDQRIVADHADHVASARIAADAVAASTSRPPVVEYRTYNISQQPANLAPAVEADKLATAQQYMAYDHYAAPGDWPARMHTRWPAGEQWAVLNSGGQPQVFVVVDGALTTWRRQADGTWTGPQTIGGAGGQLIPVAAAARNEDGRLEVFCRRVDHHLVHVWQTASSPTGWAQTWEDLGNHNGTGAAGAGMGAPVLAANADGRLQVFVKNSGGGVSTRWQTAVNGSWSGWADLGGTDVQDGLTAAQAPDGRVELFAGTRTGIAHWYQNVPNGGWTFNSAFPAAPPSSAPAAFTGADGRIRLVYRRAGGQIAVNVQTEPGGGWLQPVLGAGPAGHGPLTVTPAGGTGQVWAATPDGVVTSVLALNGAPGTWNPLLGQVDATAALTGPAGVELFGIDPAGAPLHRFGAWQPLP